MRKKNPVFAVIVLVLILGSLLFPRASAVSGERYFPFEQMESDCLVTVIREDLSVSQFVGEEHQTQRMEYALEAGQKEELFAFLQNAAYQTHRDFNLYWLIPGVKQVVSVSTTDPVSYRIILTSVAGEELLHILTTGDDYLAIDGQWIRIKEPNWGPRLEEILSGARLVQTYFA